MKPLHAATAALFKPLPLRTTDTVRLTLGDDSKKFAAEFYDRGRGNAAGGMPIKDAGSSALRTTLVGRLPEKKKLTAFGGGLSYEIPATDTTCELLRGLLNDEQLVFADEATEAVFNSVIARGEIADLCAEWNANFEAGNGIPNLGLQFPDDPAIHYALYQQLAAGMVFNSEGFALFMEQGTGKTPTAIAAICNLVMRHWLQGYQWSWADLAAFADLPIDVVQHVLSFRAPDLSAWSQIRFDETGAEYLCEGTQQRIQVFNQPKANRMFRALVVSPNNVRANWESEMKKFSTVPGKITVLRGNEINRVKQIYDATARDGESQFTMVVCGYETLTRSWDAIGGLAWDGIDKPWDFALLDESHYIKSHRTKRFETALKLRDKSAQRAILTGTPIANSILDIYTQLEFLGEGYSGFSSFEAFKRFYGVFEETEHGEKMVALQNLPFMRERLARYSFVIRKEKALPDLPDKVYDVVEVEMTQQQAEFYKELAESLAIQIEAELSDDKRPRAMIINNVLTQLLRLAQITSGFVSWSPEIDEMTGDIVAAKQVECFYPNPKIECMLDLILGNQELGIQAKGPNDKTSIWSCLNTSIDNICSALHQNGIDYVEFRGKTSEADRAEAVRRFNYDPACKVIVCNAAAGGTGLNLLGYPPGEGDKYASNHNHCIVYDQNWSMLLRSQLEDRGHRRGTREPFRVTDLCVPGTIDEEIRQRVVLKQMRALEISDVRTILSNVFKPLADYGINL